MDQESNDYMEYQRLKKLFHDMGIPGGVGMPEKEVPESLIDDIQDEQDEELAQQKMMQDLYGDDKGYQQRYMESDKEKIIAYVNTCDSQKKDKDGNVTSGEIPPEVMFSPGLAPYFSHNATMSNLDFRELIAAKTKLRTAIMTTILAMKDGAFTPEKFAQFEGAEGLLNMRLNQNKDGQERRYIGIEASETHHSYSANQRKSIKQNLMNAFQK